MLFIMIISQPLQEDLLNADSVWKFLISLKNRKLLSMLNKSEPFWRSNLLKSLHHASIWEKYEEKEWWLQSNLLRIKNQESPISQLCPMSLKKERNKEFYLEKVDIKAIWFVSSALFAFQDKALRNQWMFSETSHPKCNDCLIKFSNINIKT